MKFTSRSIAFVLCAATVAAVLIAALPGCAESDQPPGYDPEGPVVVTILPLVSLIEPLTTHEVQVLGGSGQSAHGIELRPGDLSLLARSRAVVGIGDSLEGAAAWRQIRKANGAVTSMAELLDIDLTSAQGHTCASHGHLGHDHGPTDPHLWLDPMLVDRFLQSLETKPWINAEAIADLRARVAEVDRHYQERLAPFAGAAILTHHNAFIRIADRYGLVVADVVVPYDVAEPSPSALARVTRTIQGTDVRGIFSEPQLPAAIPTRLAADSGVPLGQLDPLGTGDWFAMMNANLDELVRVLSESAPDASEPAITDAAIPAAP